MNTKKIFIVISVLILASFSLLSAKEQITAYVQPSSIEMAEGQEIEAAVIIDMGSSNARLGSYTAVVKWDTGKLVYQNYRGGSSAGFESPVVNDLKASEGKLVVASAYPYGAEGQVNVLNLKFKALGKTGSNPGFKLEFSAMAAAETFESLLADVKVVDNPAEIANNLVPQNFSLESYPNPFNPSTQVQYQIPAENLVVIEIYNVMGQKIKTLVNENQKPGTYTMTWNATDDHGNTVAAGTYFLRMQAGKFTSDRKIQLVK